MATEAIGCDFMTGPVTALHTVRENTVLAGIGSYLHSFDVHEQKSISCTLVLPCRCIHGIIGAFTRQIDSEILAVFGEKCLTVLDLKWEDKNKPQVKVKNPSIAITTKVQMTEFEDWIWDAVFLNPRDTCSLALAMGHNSVILWNWKLQKIVEKVSCVESCILYCAKFINSHWDNLILAAGTVFNEILLWSPKGQRSQSGQMSVLKSLKGHKGVIFSVDYMHQKRMMCSASDDRSIRLWQFTFDDQCQMYHDAEMSVESWENCSCICIQVLYGHSARVWDVRLLTSTLVSVGEDSTCCVWNYEGSVLQKFKGHRGKSIWSLSVDEKKRYVVTGGGDASVRLWYLSSRSERSHYTTQSLQLPEIPSGKEDDYPRSVSLLNYNEIIVITNEGCLYLYELEEKRWQTVMSDSEFRSYTVMTVSPAEPRCIGLGNIHGKLRIFVAIGNPSIWQAKDWDIYAGKIMNIHWLTETQLLTTGPEGEIKLWSFDVGSLTLECCEQYTLPECKQRWVSAAAAGQGSLICGDRGGTIHVYILGGRSKNPLQSFPKIHGKTGVTDIIFHGDSIYTTGRDGCYRVFSHDSGHMTLLNTYRVYKGFEWIDRLEIAEEGADYHVFGFQSSDFVLWSVNRNQKLLQISCGGGHRSWDCNTNGDNFRFVYQKNREVVVCDTRLEHNQIKLKNALHGREITCAKFLEASSNKCIIVTGSEDTRVQISEISHNEFGVKEMTCLEHLNGHISSVRTLCLSPSSKNAGDKRSSLMFSAGGRAQLLVWRLTAGNHTSIVTESLCSYMIGQSQRKGRTRMWKLQQIKLNPETRFMDLSSVQVSSVWSDLPNHIHILASACSDAYVRFYFFEEEKRDLHLLMESVFHEHCVLKVCCLTNNSSVDPAVYVLSAATDGCIAFWKIDRDDIHLTLQRFYESSSNKAKNHETISTKYMTATPNHFNLRENSPEKDSVIMSFDDEQGQVNDDSNSDNKDTICDKSDSVRGASVDKLKAGSVDENSPSKAVPVLVLRHHQSGINGLDWCHCQENDFLIASGGDDNALVISLIKTNSNGLVVTAKGSCLSAHATEITGVKFMSPTKLMSVSIDQRLIVWKVRITDNLIQLEQLCCKFVCVADISNMDCKKIANNGYKVVISGEGLATFEVQDIYESEDC